MKGVINGKTRIGLENIKRHWTRVISELISFSIATGSIGTVYVILNFLDHVLMKAVQMVVQAR